MRLNRLLPFASAALLLAGCATDRNPLTLDPVGPAPGAATTPGETTGTLTVYSAYQAAPDFNSRDPYRREYTDYKIFREDRTLQQEVQNTSGSILQRPQQVALAPGNYIVAAQANSYGDITVPVVIVAGQNTLVHLEGGFPWPNPRAFNATNSIRLPDDQVVGWRYFAK
jgi:hypothetical protein